MRYGFDEKVNRESLDSIIQLCNINKDNIQYIPTIAVGVLAYNHEKYILECLNTIVKQTGNFKIRVVICEDDSTDLTGELIDNFIKTYPENPRVTFRYLRSESNLGMVKNLERLIRACSDSDYTALIDGDDYWLQPDRLQKHIHFHQEHPECSMSFNSILFYFDEKQKFDIFSLQQDFQDKFVPTESLIRANIIGNISCCFYNSTYFSKLPDSFFEMFVGDWALNIAFSEFGYIGFIKEPMTVYRKHNGGIWSGSDEVQNRKVLYQAISDYNRFFNLRYNEEFVNLQKQLTFSVVDKPSVLRLSRFKMILKRILSYL